MAQAPGDSSGPVRQEAIPAKACFLNLFEALGSEFRSARFEGLRESLIVR
ncbi:MAG: hypothetical protein ACI841_003299 [Planctomycetota bacterium]|jgi:hypothetical protein